MLLSFLGRFRTRKQGDSSNPAEAAPKEPDSSPVEQLTVEEQSTLEGINSESNLAAENQSARSKPKSRFVSLVAELRGCSYDDAKALMDDINVRYGISYRTFATEDLWAARSSEDLERRAQRLASLDENYVRQVANETGWTYEQAEQRMHEVRDRYPSITYKKFYDNAFANKSDEEIAARVDEILAQSRGYAQIVSDKTGWSFAKSQRFLTRCNVVFNIISSDAVCYRAWELSDAELDCYASLELSRRLSLLCNEPEAKAVVRGKESCDRAFSEYIGRKFWVNANTTFEDFLAFAEGLDEIFCKPIGSSQGRGAFKVKLAGQDLRAVYDELMSGRRIIAEEFIVQHPDINRIYPGSINTIRVVVIKDEDGTHIIDTAMRFGYSGIVDNYSQDGLVALVDKATGVIVTPAINRKGEVYEDHPVTGTHFEGFTIPFWDEVIRVSTEAMDVLDGLCYVGWDIAIGRDKVYIVEGNTLPDPDLSQAPRSIYKKGARYLYNPYTLKTEERYAASHPDSADDYDVEPAENGGLIVAGYHGAGRVLHIPAEINGQPVVEIAVHAFSNDHELVSVTIPGSVSHVGHHAFSHCTELLKVVVEDGVTLIHSYCFADCWNLSDITLPNSIKSIYKYAFRNCVSLQELSLPANLRVLNEGVFEGCTRLEHLELPQSLKTIKEDCFKGCDHLEAPTL